jgi:hypothetical protein
MNSIDDLIEYLKSEKLWQDTLGGRSDIVIAIRSVYIQVIRKVEELKTNMEKENE